MSEIANNKPKKIRRKSGGFSLPMTLICIAFVVVVVLCATKYYDVRMARERLLEDRNNNILARGVAGQDADYVEGVARSQLDMVYPGEIIFRTTGG